MVCVLLVSGCSSDKPDVVKVAPSQESPSPAACSGNALTKKSYGVTGTEIYIRTEPSKKAAKVINQKATDIIKKPQYASIDDTTTVFEECTKGMWSWVRVTTPDWLQDSHQGWVESKHLDKGELTNGDIYHGKIPESALSRYTESGYPDTVAKFGKRLKEIEVMRRKIAEMSLDAGVCDRVVVSELSLSKSTLQSLNFWVDCENGSRFTASEGEISAKKPATKIPSDVAGIIEKTDLLNEQCRGGSGDNPATMKACDSREKYVGLLKKKGWCWGNDTQIGAEKTWQPCQ